MPAGLPLPPPEQLISRGGRQRKCHGKVPAAPKAPSTGAGAEGNSCLTESAAGISQLYFHEGQSRGLRSGHKKQLQVAGFADGEHRGLCGGLCGGLVAGGHRKMCEMWAKWRAQRPGLATPAQGSPPPAGCRQHSARSAWRAPGLGGGVRPIPTKRFSTGQYWSTLFSPTARISAVHVAWLPVAVQLGRSGCHRLVPAALRQPAGQCSLPRPAPPGPSSLTPQWVVPGLGKIDVTLVVMAPPSAPCRVGTRCWCCWPHRPGG